VLIIGRSNCINTASGSVLCKWPSDVRVEKEFLLNLHTGRFQCAGWEEFLLNLHTGRSLTDSSFSTCTPDDHLKRVPSQSAHRPVTYREFLLNLHIRRSLTGSSFSTCTPEGHLQRVPSQPAHRRSLTESSFSTCTPEVIYREFLLNLRTEWSLTESSFSTCTPDGHLQTVPSQPAHRTIT